MLNDNGSAQNLTNESFQAKQGHNTAVATEK